MIPETPAGKIQTVLEFVKAGIFDKEEAFKIICDNNTDPSKAYVDGDIKFFIYNLDTETHYSGWQKYEDSTNFPTEKKSFKFSKGCDHDWKDYIGFSASYKYCTKCDMKRE